VTESRVQYLVVGVGWRGCFGYKVGGMSVEDRFALEEHEECVG
jgi:hypothetical protein